LHVHLILHRIRGAYAKIPIVLDGHADEGGDGVLEFLGQFGLLVIRGSPRAAAAGGISVIGREGERAIEAGLSLRGCGEGAQRADERGGDEGLFAYEFHRCVHCVVLPVC